MGPSGDGDCPFRTQSMAQGNSTFATGSGRSAGSIGVRRLRQMRLDPCVGRRRTVVPFFLRHACKNEFVFLATRAPALTLLVPIRTRFPTLTVRQRRQEHEPGEYRQQGGRPAAQRGRSASTLAPTNAVLVASAKISSQKSPVLLCLRRGRRCCRRPALRRRLEYCRRGHYASLLLSSVRSKGGCRGRTIQNSLNRSAGGTGPWQLCGFGRCAGGAAQLISAGRIFDGGERHCRRTEDNGR